MGIKGLKKVLAKQIEEVKIADLRGRTVGVDVSLMVYQLYAIGLKTGLKHEGQNYHHITGMFYKTVKLLQNGITPVYFFDGPPPIAKAAELEARRAVRQFNVPNSAFEQVREICDLMGIECIISPSEAESQAVRCQLEGKIYGVLTEDTDVIALGGRQIIIGSSVQIIDGSQAPNALGLTRSQFVDFCILCGCDYSTTIPGVGPQTALKLLKQHGNIEGILTVKARPAGFDYEIARMHLTDPVVNADVKLVGRAPISPALVDRLVYYGMSRDRVEKSLKKL